MLAATETAETGFASQATDILDSIISVRQQADVAIVGRSLPEHVRTMWEQLIGEIVDAEHRAKLLYAELREFS